MYSCNYDIRVALLLTIAFVITINLDNAIHLVKTNNQIENFSDLQNSDDDTDDSDDDTDDVKEDYHNDDKNNKDEKKNANDKKKDDTDDDIGDTDDNDDTDELFVISYRKKKYYRDKENKVYEIKGDDEPGSCIGNWVKQDNGKFKVVKN